MWGGARCSARSRPRVAQVDSPPAFALTVTGRVQARARLRLTNRPKPLSVRETRAACASRSSSLNSLSRLVT